MVDLRGFEPLTSSMPWRRSPSCATGPDVVRNENEFDIHSLYAITGVPKSATLLAGANRYLHIHQLRHSHFLLPGEFGQSFAASHHPAALCPTIHQTYYS